MPRFFMSSSKFLLVPQVPVLTRIVGMPRAYDSSMQRMVWSMFFLRMARSGERNP